MNRQTYCTLTASFFAVVGILHALRLFLGWEAMLGGWVVPVWLSWVALIVCIALAYIGFTSRDRAA